MMQGVHTDQNVMTGLKTAKQTMDAVKEGMNIDQMEDLLDDLKEQQADQEEINQVFVNAAGEDKDDLADELEEMMAMDQIDDVDVGMGYVDPAVADHKKEEKKVADATAEEEDELQAMMAI
jgi:hypothetical protein